LGVPVPGGSAGWDGGEARVLASGGSCDAGRIWRLRVRAMLGDLAGGEMAVELGPGSSAQGAGEV